MLIAAVVSIGVAISFFGPKNNKYRYPAGPKGIPLFGNLFQLPPGYAGPHLAEVGKKYGDLYVSVEWL